MVGVVRIPKDKEMVPECLCVECGPLHDCEARTVGTEEERILEALLKNDAEEKCL